MDKKEKEKQKRERQAAERVAAERKRRGLPPRPKTTAPPPGDTALPPDIDAVDPAFAITTPRPQIATPKLQGENRAGGGLVFDEDLDDDSDDADIDPSADTVILPPDADMPAKPPKAVITWLGRSEVHTCPNCGARILQDRATKACLVTKTYPMRTEAGEMIQYRDMLCRHCRDSFLTKETVRRIGMQ